MRPKVVLAILLVAIGVLGIAVVFSKRSRPQPAAVAPAPPAVASVPPAPAPTPAIATSPAPTPATNGGTNAIALQKAQHEEYVEKRASELDELSMESDPAAHQQIVDELKNPDRAIRKAALDALEQADDRSVVPQMQQIADQTTDPDDKQAIEDAIDFINLPSLTEYLKQRNTQTAASGNQPSSQSSSQPPPPQRHMPGQNPPAAPGN